MKKISKKEYNTILIGVGSVNELFAGMWLSFEKMVFDDGVESVELEIHNNNFRLVANPDVWKSYSQEKKYFVICHEMCHVMFGHWLINPKHDSEWSNIAQDIVVNEYLSTMFDLSKFGDDFATIKTVFKHKADMIESRMDYTYYYNILMQCLKPSRTN